MKITKFVHSCVLVEEGSKVVLFDPGGFTWNNGSFDLSQIKHLDSIAITHSHGDHLNPEYMRGYVDGYEMARLEIIRRVKEMESLSDCTATVELTTPKDKE